MFCAKCGNAISKAKCNNCGYDLHVGEVWFLFEPEGINTASNVSSATTRKREGQTPHKRPVQKGISGEQASRKRSVERGINVGQVPHMCSSQSGMLAAQDFKKGAILEIDGVAFLVLESQFVKPGRGAAFVRTKLKNIKSGGVLEKSFRPTEKCAQARIDRMDMQYLYSDGNLYHFMDQETFEQITLSKDVIGDALKFVKENDVCKICFYNGNVVLVEPPMFVELEVTETEPGYTTTGIVKPATVETNAIVYVPLFVDIGDKIKIDTCKGEYLCRV